MMRQGTPFLLQLARWAMFAAVACSVPAAFAGPDKTVPKGKPSMNQDTRSSVMQALTLRDADAYYTLDPAALAGLVKHVSDLAQAPSRSQQAPPPKGPLPELRVIGAPPQVDWAARSTLPLLIAEVRSNGREWEVASRQNRHVVVSNLSTGTVQVVDAQDKGRRMPQLRPSRSGNMPDAFNAALSSINVLQRDMLLWLPREQLQGRLAVTMLDYDLPSNTVEVKASGASETPPSTPARPARLLVKPDPSVPPLAGIGASLGRAPEASPSASSRLLASFKLPRTRLTVLKGSPGGVAPWFVTASLVLVQLDRADSPVMDLAVDIPAETAEIGAGFSLDLDKLAAAGQYMAYLVVGDAVAGPVPVRIGER